MTVLSDLSLDQRLSAMVSLVSGLMLALAVAIFAGASVSGARDDLHNRLLAWSDAIASASKSGLMAEDVRATASALLALEAEPQVMSATVLRADGSAIAGYQSTRAAQQGDAGERLFATALGALFDRHLSVERPIVVDGGTIGRVHLAADLADSWLIVERRLGLICALAGAGYLVMMYFARRMRRAILRPIDRLAQAANAVCAHNRYTLRVAKESSDEIGALVDAFNRMLAQIEARDAKIESARVELERRTEELTVSNAQLKSEVDERRAAEAALREAKDLAEAAERASRAKSQFLANMSLEIRAPMASVQGLTELLLASELSARQRHYAESVQRSNETLLDVFNGILDFSKVEAGRMEIEAVEFSLRETIAEVVRQLSERATRKGLRLASRCDPQVPGRVVGDPSRLKQVLVNLVGNAIKFTERGDVRIRLGVTDREGDTFALRFAVQDTGVGIAPHSHESIFEAFSQLEGESEHEESGSGLGLAVAKQLVNLMGGEIGVESMPGRGSTFWFTVRVPQARGDALITARHDAAEPPIATRFHGRVLVALADREQRESLAEVLRAHGLEPAPALTGGEALDVALSGAVDLAFVDCDSAEIDGHALTRAVRDAHSKTVWRMPIIGLSAAGSEDERERSLRAGMDDHLAAPLEPTKLLRSLARWLPAVESSDIGVPGDGEIAPEALKTLEFDAIAEIRALVRDDGQELLDKVVGLYCDTVPQMLRAMEEAARRGDCAALCRDAHALGTSSCNVGAMRLAQLCRDLEHGARNGTIRLDRLTAAEFEIESVLSKLKRVA